MLSRAARSELRSFRAGVQHRPTRIAGSRQSAPRLPSRLEFFGYEPIHREPDSFFIPGPPIDEVDIERENGNIHPLERLSNHAVEAVPDGDDPVAACKLSFAGRPVLGEQPESASSASPVWVEVKTSAGPKRAQIG